jgi:hypothetical protein
MLRTTRHEVIIPRRQAFSAITSTLPQRMRGSMESCLHR